jgi:probable HAF family extracellular repeat protein
MNATARLQLTHRVAAVGALAFLSACQSNGLTPPQNTAFQAGAAPTASAAQHQKTKVAQYSATELATLGGTFGTANGINNKGWVTGLDALSSGNIHASRWAHRQVLDLGTLGGPNSYSSWPVKSNAGDISGASDTSATDPYSENFCGDNVPDTCLGFDWRGGVMHALPTLGGNNGQAAGNNSRGDIVGFSETATQDPSCVAPQVFDIGAALWDRRTGHVTQLQTPSGDIVAAAIEVNDRGDIVGGSGPVCGSPSFAIVAHPVLWPHGSPNSPISLPTLGGSMNNFATAINNRGDIAGTSDVSGDTAMHAAFWKRGKITDLGTLPGDLSSQAFGINQKDQIVGVSCDASGNCRAVLWENGSIYDLNTLIPSSSNLYLIYGGDINDSGVIAGQAVDLTTGNQPAFQASPTGKMAAPTPRQKAAPPGRIREQLMRNGFGRFHPGLVRH